MYATMNFFRKVTFIPRNREKKQLENMANKQALILYKMTNESAYGT